MARHQEWLAARSCTVLRLEGDMTVLDRVRKILDSVDGLNQTLPVM